MQQPHVRLADHVASLGVELSHIDADWLGRKEAAARQLISHRPDLAGTVRMLDATAAARRRETLDARQLEFLAACARRLAALPHWEGREIQDALFESARDIGIDPRADAALVFGALYQVLFGAQTGPRAGSYLAFIGRHETLQRLG